MASVATAKSLVGDSVLRTGRTHSPPGIREGISDGHQFPAAVRPRRETEGEVT
jgi:hypothetical protein